VPLVVFRNLCPNGGLAYLGCNLHTLFSTSRFASAILFVASLPFFNTIRADLPDRIAGIAFEQDYGAFISLTERVLELDTIFRSASQSQVPRSGRVAAVPAIAPVVSSLPPPSSSIPDPPSRVAKPAHSHSALTCNNCCVVYGVQVIPI
jgi:hypothetical protein